MSNKRRPLKKVHSKIEILDKEVFYQFLNAIYALCPQGEYFRAGIGIVYLSLNQPTETETEKAIDDLWFSFGQKGIRVVRVLTQKPKPERTYLGQWIGLKQWKEVLSIFKTGLS